MLSDEHRRRTRLFNEKAVKLLGLSFTQAAFDRSTGFQVAWAHGQPLTAQRTGPQGEAIDAFLLTFRFFVEDRDRISLKMMAEVYASAPKHLADRYLEMRNTVNGVLDEPCMVQIDGEAIPRRHLLDVFLYGGFSHAHVQKKATYDAWRSVPLVFMLPENEFVTTLAEVCNAVAYVRALNEALLAQEPPGSALAA